jgi:hypothetical protein
MNYSSLAMAALSVPGHVLEQHKIRQRLVARSVRWTQNFKMFKLIDLTVSLSA